MISIHLNLQKKVDYLSMLAVRIKKVKNNNKDKNIFYVFDNMII